MGILGYVERLDEVRAIVTRVMDAVPSGSYLVLWDGTDTGTAVKEGSERLTQTGAIPYYLRNLEQLGQCFDGLEMIEPGLVPITYWRLAESEVSTAQHIDVYGA
ncbi:SAM-dependent methyltransferase [Acrocarpospora corrugata]